MLDNITLIFFVLFIPLSGFIAWAGDRIGHKSGKKRHSLFGLRPRHTAMCITVGAGMLIALVSFGLMYGVSETFRVVVHDGAALTEKNRELKADNALLEEQAARSQQNAFRSAAERRTADAARDLARTEQFRAEEATKKARTLAQNAQQRLTAETKELIRARNDLQKAGHALSVVQTGLRVKNAQLEAAKQRVEVARQEVASAEKQQGAAEAQAKSAEGDARRVRSNAEQAVALQTKNLDTLRGQLASQTASYYQQKNDTEQQRIELTRLTKELERRRKELDQTTASAAAMRRRQIIYQVGEEVARVQINKGITSWRAQGILDSFLTTTAKKAEARGAERGGETRAAMISPQSFTQGTNGNTVLVTEDDRIRAAADAILQAKTDVVVVAIATANAVAGEPVPVDFKMYRNPLVYAANATIGETTVNGTVSKQEIADSLYGFLHRDVRRNLLKAGIIPLARGGDTTDTPGIVEAGDIAALNGEDWLQVIENVRDAGEKARVVVRASKALRAGDSVALRFEVRGQRNALRR